jgi:hypothetical protein
MSSGNILRGFLMYGTKNESMLWTEDILALFNVLADLFNNALEHRNADTL